MFMYIPNMHIYLLTYLRTFPKNHLPNPHVNTQRQLYIYILYETNKPSISS